MRKTRLLALIGLVLATALTACGGGGGDAFQSPSTGGSGTSSTANAVVALTLTASSQSVPVDGSGSATITATALNAANATVSGVAVNFSVTTGALAGWWITRVVLTQPRHANAHNQRRRKFIPAASPRS